MSAFRTEILRAYERQNCLHPFIGEAFESAESAALRVMTVGINVSVRRNAGRESG